MKRKKWPLGDLSNAQTWRPLQNDDVVDIVAPGSGTDAKALKTAVQFLKSLGLKPRVPAGLLGKEILFSNSDEYRFQTLKQALLNDDSRAIWCLRGGYGSIRLLPQLSRLKRPHHSKIFIGFSDITTIHSFLNFFWQWPTLHGPNLDRFSLEKDSKRDREEFLRLLMGWKSQLEFKNLKALNSAARKSKYIVSTVVGGNLCVLNSSLGTPWQVDLSGKILFLEDRGEKNHRIDRMLTQMQQAGMFRGVKALLLGDFSMENKKEERMIWNDSIQRFAMTAKFPVLKGLPCGHGDRQRILPLLTKAYLHLGPQSAQLTLASGTVDLNKNAKF